jgi:hypothetical protein
MTRLCVRHSLSRVVLKVTITVEESCLFCCSVDHIYFMQFLSSFYMEFYLFQAGVEDYMLMVQ